MESVSQNPRVLGNRYELGDLLGRGGMAEVHLGRDTRLGRVVAIKLLRADLARDPMFQARFRREAQSCAGLNHPSIVAVYDTAEEALVEPGGGVIELPYIVMEYVEGRTLREVLREGRTMDVTQALKVTSGVLSALDYSHRMGIVHRDIKPANVMLTATGAVKVMDFGIARALADTAATMTQTQAVIGTAQYLSPEQARGETVDARSDLYSAGCLLFELLTGRPPFVADSPVAVAYQHVREPAVAPSTLNPGVPAAVDRLVLHALEKERESRYQSAEEFRADIEATLAGRALGAAARRGTENATEVLPPGYPAGPGGPGGAQDARTVAMGAPGGPGVAAPGAPMDRTSVDGVPPVPYPPGAQYPPGSPGGPGRAGRGQEPRRGRSAGYAVLAVVVALVFGGSAYAVRTMLNSGITQSDKQMIKVTGLTQDVAATKLREAGISADIVTQNSDLVAKGLVISTDPGAGQVIRSGQAVKVYVSLGKATRQVPDLRGLTSSTARDKLYDAGLTLGSPTQQVSSSTYDKGQVVDTDPAPGTNVAQGTKVVLKVANGTAELPDVTGMDLEKAKTAVQQAGFTIDVVRGIYSTAKANSVLSQTPAPGKAVDRAQKVTLNFAVPDPGASSPATSTDPNAQPSPSDSGAGGPGGVPSPTDSGLQNGQ